MNMKKLIIIGFLLFSLALRGLAQNVVSPGMDGLQTRNALNTAFSEVLGVVDTVSETIRIEGIQVTAKAAEVNILDGALVNVTELNRLVGIPGNIVTLLAGKENSLGNPSVDGYVPSKSVAGVVTWIAPGGGAEYPEGSGIPTIVDGSTWGATIGVSSAENYSTENYGTTGMGDIVLNSGPTITNPTIYYTPRATGTVVAGTGITATMLSRFMYFNTTSAIDITADPQISNGTSGQIITIIGSSDTNTLTLDDAAGLRLTGQMVLGIGDNITLLYESTIGDWIEISRSNN
jgi:hypothetical protein